MARKVVALEATPALEARPKRTPVSAGVVRRDLVVLSVPWVVLDHRHRTMQWVGLAVGTRVVACNLGRNPTRRGLAVVRPGA